jgi:hypothetical protein
MSILASLFSKEKHAKLEMFKEEVERPTQRLLYLRL